MRVDILGGGVSGLTCGVVLAEAGHDVTVRTPSDPLATTSIVAAAVWYPVPGADADVAAWVDRSRAVFAELARDPASGVVSLPIRELHRRAGAAGRSHPTARPLDAASLPESYAGGHVIDTFRIEPPVYLPWMVRRLEDAGGELTRMPRPLTGLGEALAEDSDVIVNATGLGARALVPDPLMRPVRGQVVHVVNPGLAYGVVDEDDIEDMFYAFPRSQVVVLGGTREPDRWDLDPDPATTDRILAAARRLVPELADPEVVDVAVGLRPGRPRPRVEREDVAGRIVIHNYGHDGNGYTLSWGCAEAVLRLVD